MEGCSTNLPSLVLFANEIADMDVSLCYCMRRDLDMNTTNIGQTIIELLDVEISPHHRAS